MTHIAFYQVLTDDVKMPLPNTNPSGTEENATTQKLIFNPADDIELNASGQHRPLISYQVDLCEATSRRRAEKRSLPVHLVVDQDHLPVTAFADAGSPLRVDLCRSPARFASAGAAIRHRQS